MWLSHRTKQTSRGIARSRIYRQASACGALALFAAEGQLTSEIRPLVAPHLSAMILIPKIRGRLFFFDETDVYWCPDTGRIYQLPFRQAKIDSPGKNQVRYLLGSVEYPTGEGLYEIYPHKRNEEVEQHLAH